MQPILKYPGAKWRLSNWIIGHMPPHEGYLEPYAGSLAVLLNKPPSRIETVNDLDGSIVRFFRTCRERPDELAAAISLTPWARDEYKAAELEDNAALDDVEAARQFLVRAWMAFGSCMSEKTGWRHTTGKKKDGGPDNPKLWGRLPQLVQEVAERLMQVQIENRPALDTIKRLDGPEMLIYADPPYVRETRTAHSDQYRFEMTDNDHKELLQTLNNSKSMILLSGYDCELYRDTLSSWTVKAINTQAERGARRQECLWINPVAAERLAGQFETRWA